MKLGAGHPMGPLALLDFIGLDVAAAIGEEIDRRCPIGCGSSSPRGGWRKSGAGFYEYGE